MALGQNIRNAREAKGLTLEQLSELSGVEVGTISALENRDSARSQFVTELARALGLTVDSLLSRHGPPQLRESSPAEWTGPDSRAGRPMLSLKAIPRLEWSSLMHAPLPAKFELESADDSMAPRVRAGQVVTFDSTLEPRPGDGVLVADRQGHTYLRLYRQRRPGAWEAHAVNDAYQALSADVDGLRILAVVVGVQARWS